MQSFVKTLTAIVVLALLAGGAYLGYRWWQERTEKDRQIEEQKRIIADLENKLDRAWSSDLVADVRVNAVREQGKSGGPEMDVTFAEYAPGTETTTMSKSMTLLGEELYVDALVVQFDRPFVEAGDGLRGKSVLLFRRMFGDRQRPIDGVSLVRTDAAKLDLGVPETFAVDATPGSFERDLWSKFWIMANDPKAAAAAGVRVAQGEAPHVHAVQGQVYKIVLRKSGGLEVTPRLPASMVGAAASSQ